MGTLVLAIRRDGRYALRTLRRLRWTSRNAPIYRREGTSWVNRYIFTGQRDVRLSPDCVAKVVLH